MAQGGQKLIPQPRAGLGIELLATGPQQVELKKTIGQGHEDHLIDHQGEGPGAEILKGREKHLSWRRELLNGWAQAIVPPHLNRVPHFLPIQEHPQLPSAVSISLPVDDHTQGHWTARKTLNAPDPGHLRTEQDLLWGRLLSPLLLLLEGLLPGRFPF
ncbi:hypothetical protein HKBW3S44_00773 [Candidatus Hakubella thermalkaliphila]|uniref:Uncharacterized protein n=1 Tax=Candidatus Hakubella thermalkaliphila TaxID=2754717 RepID=A0A6V8PY48_9ACTN|nr:hypothetical protein HKBW3S44_00773 [Candidatus Hakubella thermalkaliphila]